MKNLSKMIAVLLSLFIACSLVACGKNGDKDGYSITLSSNSIKLTEGENKIITAELKKNNKAFDGEISWSTANSDIAIVSNGDIKALKFGSTTITASFKGATSTILVNVEKFYEPQVSVSLDYNSISLPLNGVFTLTASVNDALLSSSIVWLSLDKNVATVANGVVTAIAEGTTSILAKINGKYIAQAVCEINVSPFVGKVTATETNEAYVYETNMFYTNLIDVDSAVLRVNDLLSGESIEYDYDSEAKQLMIVSAPSVYGNRMVEIELANLIIHKPVIFVSDIVFTANELMSALQDNEGKYIVLKKDIDFSEYLKENPWDEREPFFNINLKGALDGDGYGLYNINSTRKTMQIWENSVIKELSGELRNLYIEASQAITVNEGRDSSTFIGSFSGTIDNCIININNSFDNNNGQYMTGLFYRSFASSSFTNSLVYLPSDRSTRLFSSTAFSEEYHNKGAFNNVTFVEPNFKYDTLLANQVNTQINDVYLYTINTDKSLNKGKKLSDNYANGSISNSETLWQNSDLKINETLKNSSIEVNNTLIKLNGRVMYDMIKFDAISSAEEFVANVRTKPNGNYRLTKNIDMTEYLKANPWNENVAFFDVDFSGILDGNGYAISNLVCSMPSQNRWQNAVFLTMSGSLINLYLETGFNFDVAMQNNGRPKDNSILIGAFTGKIDNCIIKATNNYSISENATMTGLFYNSTASASFTNSLVYLPNDTSSRLFSSSAYNDRVEMNQGTFNNVVFIRPNYDFNALLALFHNSEIENIYLFTIDGNKALNNGKKLIDSYKTGIEINSVDLWENSQRQINDILPNIKIENKLIKLNNNVVGSL